MAGAAVITQSGPWQTAISGNVVGADFELRGRPECPFHRGRWQTVVLVRRVVSTCWPCDSARRLDSKSTARTHNVNVRAGAAPNVPNIFHLTTFVRLSLANWWIRAWFLQMSQRQPTAAKPLISIRLCATEITKNLPFLAKNLINSRNPLVKH